MRARIMHVVVIAWLMASVGMLMTSQPVLARSLDPTPRDGGSAPKQSGRGITGAMQGILKDIEETQNGPSDGDGIIIVDPPPGTDIGGGLSYLVLLFLPILLNVPDAHTLRFGLAFCALPLLLALFSKG